MKGLRTAVLVAAGLLPNSGYVAEISWRGQPMEQVRSKDALPPFIKSYLQTDMSGQFRVSDIGQRIRMTDVVIGDDEPDRRFVGAAHGGDTWLVAIEHATGFGSTGAVVHLFESGRLTGVLMPQLRPARGVITQQHDLATVIAAVDKPAPIAKLGVISPGMSRAEVEARLGPPERISSADEWNSSALELRYPGLVVLLMRSRVMSMTSTSSTFCLTATVCPGASTTAIQAAMGDPYATYLPRGDSYYQLNFLCQATISSAQEMVRSVAIGCGDPVKPVLAKEYDATAMASVMRDLDAARAVQVLLVAPEKQYPVTLVDADAARSRVHADACRYVTTDKAAVAELRDIMKANLLGASSQAQAARSGGGDFRLGILFEADGKRLTSLYIETPAKKDGLYMENAEQEVYRGVFDGGNLYMKQATREKVETWLARPAVSRAQTSNAAQSRLPCTTAAVTKLTNGLPAEPVLSSVEFKEALSAGLRKYRANRLELQNACSREGQTREFCGCLAARLAAPYIWAENGWAAYKDTLQQGRYPSATNPWFPAQKYSDQQRIDFFELDEIAQSSCTRDTTPLPSQPVRPPLFPPPAVVSRPVR